MKVAIYVRVSLPTKIIDKTTKEKHYKQETDNQLIPLRNYVNDRSKEGWIIIDEYVDRATARNDDREHFKRMFTDAAKHKFDLLLFWKLDRFTREGVLATLQHLKKLTEYGVVWKSYTEQYIDSAGPFKDVILAVLACVAEQERVKIQERTLAGLARAREKGKVGGRPRLITNREEIKAKYLQEHWSITKISRSFKMSRMSVYRIVRGEDAHSKEQATYGPTLLKN